MTRVRSLRLPSALALVALAASACGNGKPKGPDPDAWLHGGATPGSAAAGGPKAPPPPAASAASGRKEFAEAEFSETERSRDPFRSYSHHFVEEAKGQVRSQREVVLSEFAVDDLKLIGIVTRIEPARAMLVDPSGKGHVVHRGDFVGRADIVQLGGQSGSTYQLNWRLDRIRDGDVVLVREDPNNPDVPAATKVIPLRPESAEEKAKGG
ncbi:MAG TPA: pilus assembly protein PilP [Polyangiaceae bacterium]|jgi:type IV pilus assembly protein PilP|nr:pilus assembly protein PilP [Polyangiaceae bacterium]